MIFLKMVMMRMETYKTNFKKAYIKANEILVSSCVLAEFPVKAKKIIESKDNIKCCSYKKALKFHGLNIEDFGSKSAVLIKCENKNIIFYNESELKARIRFSILHEFGHVLDEYCSMPSIMDDFLFIFNDERELAKNFCRNEFEYMYISSISMEFFAETFARYISSKEVVPPRTYHFLKNLISK